MLHWSKTFLWRQKIDNHRTTQFKVADIARSLDVGHKMLKGERADVMYLSIQLSEISSRISREAV